jgi:hypothetical protein
MSIQIDATALAHRIAVLDEIGVGPLWLRRDAVIEGMPLRTAPPDVAAPVSRSVSKPVSTPASTPIPASVPARKPAPATRSTDDAAWDDGTMHSMAAAPVKTILTLCTSTDVADAGRYLFIARASSVQGSEELFDNIVRALGMQREEGSQGELAGLTAQIAAHRPSVLIAMGPAAALQLIGDPAAGEQPADGRNANADAENTRFESLRGRLHRIDALPVLVTYEATQLLRNPGDKRKAWEDLCLLQHLQAADVADPA